MAHYIIVCVYSGLIWGDTRDFDGEAYNASSVVDACRRLDESVYGTEGREYEEVTRLDGDTGHAVYRVDINGVDAVPVFEESNDYRTYIEAMQNKCQFEGYVQITVPGEE